MPQFDDDREAVIARAFESGLEAIITVSTDIESNIQAIDLARKHDRVYCTVGIHPHNARSFTEESYTRLKEWAAEEKVVAIGETGLDYHYDYSPRDVQMTVMERHLALALESGLPAVIHSREAKNDTLRIIRESGISKGVMHCFSGDMEMAETAMSLGLYISVAGPVTFKKARRLKDIVKNIPDDYLLVETDAPYLTPEPFRGKRNEPAHVDYVAREIAELRGISPEDIARITTLNARRLFGIGKLPGKGEVAYRIRDSLYLNITNRCTNRCSFCVRFYSDFVKGHNLRLSDEPTLEELKAEVGDPSAYKEVVFCGYGEPFLRLDTVIELSRWIKSGGGTVRVNTNGHGNLIYGRNILPELKGLVDVLSVSLNAHDAETYNRICLPEFKDTFEEVKRFILKAKKHINEVYVTVVDMEGTDISKCREIAEELSVALRVRKLHAVG
jgi:TatD DNase family protein